MTDAIGMFMRQLALLLTFWLALLPGAAAAQQPVWLQVEARPTLAEAEARARAYAGTFGNVAGFRLASGWYAIALGPYAPEEAASRLADLRAGNLVPRDSFLARGEAYGAPFLLPGEAPVGSADEPSAPVDPFAPLTPGTGDASAPGSGDIAAADPAASDPSPTLAQPDETEDEARASEAALGDTERMDLQSALRSFGFYDGAIDGAVGPGTRDAMAAWQADNGYFASGILTSAERRALLGARDKVAAELDLQTVTDEEAGIRIDLPRALVRFQDYQPPFVHYAEADGSGVRAVLISEPGTEATLATLYDRLQTLEAMPRTGPRRLDGTRFRIEGTGAATSAYAQAEAKDGAVKGFMLIWDRGNADKAGRALTAMQRSFASIGPRALDPGLVALSDAQRRNLMAGMEVRRPALSRSGFFVDGAGAVLTTVQVLDDCRRITLDRDHEADVTFRDDAMGVALLTPKTPLAPAAVAEFSDAVRIGAAVSLAGYSYADVLPSAAITRGAVEDVTGLSGEAGLNRLSVEALPGDAGGPVLDADGGVMGMLLPHDADAARTLPAGVSFVATAASLKARLEQAGIVARDAASAAPLPPDGMTKRAAALTVLVSCWK